MKAAGANSRDPYNQLSDWNYKMGSRFELGTMYTLIAGLLNLLAIYDAWVDPYWYPPRIRRKTTTSRKKNRKRKRREPPRCTISCYWRPKFRKFGTPCL